MALSTLGIQFKYAKAANETTPPASAYTDLADYITDFPGFSSSANTIDVTPIGEDAYMRYVAGLADTGGAVDVTFNLGANEITAIEAMKTAASTATEKGVLWFLITHPRITGKNSFAFKAETGSLALPALAPNSAYQTTISLIPNYVVDGLVADPDTTP